MNRIAVVGSTGSIGRSALAVAEAHPERLKIVALAAGENAALMAEQVARFEPRVAAMASDAGVVSLDEALRSRGVPARPAVGSGGAGLLAVATAPEVDTVLFASSGTASLEAVLAAIEAGKRIALANKEILVMAGALVMDAARRCGVDVLPVDSEHNALHQCLDGRRLADVRRLILTASGGPFRGFSATDLESVTAGDALRHPTWNMGPKITVDSATLMNKGLEVIEARWLFGIEPARIAVLVHPQSIVHSMVEFVDGSFVAQLGVTDMRLPIQYALSYPDRWPAAVPPLDLATAAPLTFEPADTSRFPCLRLAFEALGGDAGLPVALNAANEVAVASFLEGHLPFTAIPRVIAAAMEHHASAGPSEVCTVGDVRAIDGRARRFSAARVGELRSKVL